MSADGLKLNRKEKYAYIKSLIYILNLSKKSSAEKDGRQKTLIENRMSELSIPLEEFSSLKSTKNAESIIDDLASITNMKIKKYILREMILLAIADHELTDIEISTIYRIGANSGIKEESISDFFLWAAKGVEWQIEGVKLLEENI